VVFIAQNVNSRLALIHTKIEERILRALRSGSESDRRESRFLSSIAGTKDLLIAFSMGFFVCHEADSESGFAVPTNR